MEGSLSFIPHVTPMANLHRVTPLILISFLAACGDDATQEASGPETPESPVLEGTASPMDTMLHVTIPLTAVGGSGVTGEAMAMHSQDVVMVILELDGLTAGMNHPAHIHAGTCAAGGPVAVPLTPVTGLANGTGASTTSLDADELRPSQSYFIQVHAGDGTPVACGDMEGHGNS